MESILAAPGSVVVKFSLILDASVVRCFFFTIVLPLIWKVRDIRKCILLLRCDFFNASYDVCLSSSCWRGVVFSELLVFDFIPKNHMQDIVCLLRLHSSPFYRSHFGLL